MPAEVSPVMTWGIRAVIRTAEGQGRILGELKCNGEPYGYDTRETASEAIKFLVSGPLLQFTGMLEPFETGREISFAEIKDRRQSRAGIGEFSLTLNSSG